MIIIDNTPRSPCAGSWLANLVDVVHFLTVAFFTYQKKSMPAAVEDIAMRLRRVHFSTDMPTEGEGDGEKDETELIWELIFHPDLSLQDILCVHSLPPAPVS